MQSIDSLIEANKGLVYLQLRRFKLINDPEAESLAFEGLLKAVTTYDESSGAKLSTYAMVIIYNTLGSYIRSLNAKRQINVVSYNSIAFSDEHGDHEFAEFLAASDNIEQQYVRKELQQHAMQAFDKLYDKLTNAKHRAILYEWKMSGFTAQTKDIALIVDVSQSYVSQVINNFKYNLRKELEDMYYD